ncbi:ABC-2 type transport system ATP-binding protein [Ruminococcaceae bacterium KH2T8]|nr:ABC-2 type transport system ATP-binding protein [Ruminococcaceae bacterium KH2T8]
MGEDYLLQTTGITKRYKDVLAVDHIDLKLKKGEIYGLIGRNGAGKTTLLKMLAGLANPTEGDYTIFGLNGRKTAELRDRVGVLIERPGLFNGLTAFQNMKVKSLALGLNDDAYIKELLKTVGLDNVGKRPVRKYSLGMKQRLGIALSLVGHPDLLLLDEPINGLDPQGIIEVREIIERLAKEQNITIIISSHILEELTKTATRYGVINEGRLIAEFTHEELLERCNQLIELRPDDATKAATVLESLGIRDYKNVDKRTIQIFEKVDECGNLVLEMAKNGIEIHGVEIKHQSLEDYYISLTEKDSRARHGDKK